MTQTVPFSPSEYVDIRRFCGYPALSGIGLTFVYDPGVLETMLGRMTDQEQAVVRTIYLPPLYTLEASIPAAVQNLDTDQAAVWYHNKSEVADKTSLFDQWRVRLCLMIGVTPGPLLNTGKSQIIRT